MELGSIQGWEEWMRAAGRPQTTIRLRRYHLERMMREVPDSVLEVEAETLVRWVASQTWAPETRRAYRASLRSFFSWVQATGRRPDNPGKLLPTIKVPAGQPRPTPDLIYRAALREAGPRVRLAIMLAGQCGLRRAEIAGLHARDLEADLLGITVRVTGKGGRVRLVPIPDVARDLEALLLEASLEGTWLFPSQRGGHVSPHYLGKIVSAALPPGWTCHTLRHRCATVSYAAQRDLRAVQELLGHAKPETTARYTQVPAGAVRAAVNAAAL